MGLRKSSSETLSPQRFLAYELLEGSSSDASTLQRYRVVWMERSKPSFPFPPKSSSNDDVSNSIKTTPVSVQEWTQLLLSHEQLLIEFIQVLQKGNTFKAYFWETPGVTPHSVSTQKMEFVLVPAPQLHQFAGSEKNQQRTAAKDGGISPSRNKPTIASTQPALSSPFDTAFQKAHCPQRQSSICVFENLGGDATLIAPMPTTSAKNTISYGHLADFVRTAPMKHIQEFVRTVLYVYQQTWTQPVEQISVHNATTTANRNAPTALPAASWTKHSHSPAVWMSTNGMGIPWLNVRLDTHPKYYTYAPYRSVGGGGDTSA